MLEIDYETASNVDLTKAGLDLYVRCPNFRVLMAAYAIDGGEWQHWEAHKGPPPAELTDALMDSSCVKWAFNSQFERVVTRRGLKVPTAVKGWRCTQVLASLQSFAGRLEEVGQRVGLPFDKQKLQDGKRLIKMFTMPQKPTKTQPHVWRDWNTDPLDWELFCEYNIQDCVAERAIRERLIRYPVPEIEWELYELDQIINDRGKPVDMTFVENAIHMSSRRREELTSEMRDLTGLANPGSPVQLLEWLCDRGYPFRDLRKDTVSKVLTENGNVSEAARMNAEAVRVLKLRQWQARLSVKKYDAIKLRTGPDGRCRYLLQMAGAARTARWAGRGPQPQNLATTPAFLEDLPVLTAVTQYIRDDDYEALQLFDSEPMASLVGCVRSSFRAEEGHEFVVADLASIESAVVGWLSGCERLLNVFRTGLDPYKDFATELFQIAYDDVNKAQRKIAKPGTLGCSYRLGGGEMYDGKRTGLWGYAENMGVDMTRAEAHKSVKVFRETYPEIPAMWKALENAIEAAMKTRGRRVPCGKLVFEFRKPYLLMWLPSGRPVFYYGPKMIMRTVKTGRIVQKIAPRDMNPQECYFTHGVYPGEEYEGEDTYQKLSFTYMGQDQKTRAWVRIDSHGGRTIEQATQATARDVLAYGGLLRAHRAGYVLCSHVHDEVVVLRRKGDDHQSLQGLIDLMKAPFDWAPGLPLNAAGYVGQFYRKD